MYFRIVASLSVSYVIDRTTQTKITTFITKTQ